jgi:hypothetical protein
MTLADGLLVRPSTSHPSTQLTMAIIALARVHHLEQELPSARLPVSPLIGGHRYAVCPFYRGKE